MLHVFSLDPSIEGPPEVSYKTQFLDAVRLWKRREDDKRVGLCILQCDKKQLEKNHFMRMCKSMRVVVIFPRM